MKNDPLIAHTVAQITHYPIPSENTYSLSDDVKLAIDSHVSKYPHEHKRSALMPALTIAQNHNGGMLTKELIESVASYLELASISAQEVASFYSMYEHKPQGRYKISVCHNISCMLCGGDDLIAYMESKLGIKCGGEVTKDGRFSLKKVECLAACAGAPMMQIGDEYYENLTPQKVDQVLDNLE